MQSVTNGGRGIVPISSSDAISINCNATAPALPGAIAKPRADADVGAILGGAAASSHTPQAAPGSRVPQLFSASAPASPAATLATLQPALDGLSQKLSMALAGSAKPVSQPPAAHATASKTPNADWPYPDLGPRPFMSSPSGSGPNGRFGFNPTYFPTLATSKAIAQMLGGKVVPKNDILSAPGSHFKQNQPNYMIELPNGNVINPGPVAQAIALKQPRPMIDAIIDSEVNNTLVDVGHAPVFVPANFKPSSNASLAPPAASAVPSRTTAAPVLDWSAVDQLVNHMYSAPGSTAADDAAGSLRLQMERVLVMFQLLSQSAPIHPASQPKGPA